MSGKYPRNILQREGDSKQTASNLFRAEISFSLLPPVELYSCMFGSGRTWKTICFGPGRTWITVISAPPTTFPPPLSNAKNPSPVPPPGPVECPKVLKNTTPRNILFISLHTFGHFGEQKQRMSKDMSRKIMEHILEMPGICSGNELDISGNCSWFLTFPGTVRWHVGNVLVVS